MTQASEPPVQRILLVEDNPSDVFLLRTALHKAGMRFELQVVEDGEQALKALEELRSGKDVARPDVILLDLNLPRCGGVEVLRAIRKSSALTNVPVAIYTSSDSPVDRKATTGLGVRNYILKPEQLWDLGRIVAIVKDLGNPAGANDQRSAG